MRFHLKDSVKEKIIVFSISGMIVVAFYFALNNLGFFSNILKMFITIITPFIMGFALAFVLTPLCNLIEYGWLADSKFKPKTRRKIAVFGSVFAAVGLVALFGVILIPQVVDSIRLLINSMGEYANVVSGWIEELLVNGTDMNLNAPKLAEQFETFLGDFVKNITSYIPDIIGYTYSAFKMLLNCFIAIIICIYLLTDKEFFQRQARRVTYAFLPTDVSEMMVKISLLTGRAFNLFIFGKALDSLIIGIICLVVMLLSKMPYAPLISIVVGVTNMIPVFGPFIGAVPCILMLLIVNPMRALDFAIFIFILQQIDGNILGPYILGDSLGLPSFWVMFAILVGGGLFGILGMFIGVPIFSVIYFLVKDIVDERLEKKRLVVE